MAKTDAASRLSDDDPIVEDAVDGWTLHLESEGPGVSARTRRGGGSCRSGEPLGGWSVDDRAAALSGSGVNYELHLLGEADVPRSDRSTGRGGPERLYPRPGDERAGFRIVSELGRGAFARVYLAEQRCLANRLVALKVAAQSIGEESQILARLQHTHIVPILSLHEDEKAGLTYLCMPYLGGADLSQILKATVGTRRKGGVNLTGGSLVAALDRFAARPDSGSSRDSSLRVRGGRAFLSSDRHESLSAASEAASSEPGSTRARLERYWARFSPWARSDPSGELPVPEEPGLSQPMRRYLMKASYIQAAVWIAARLAEGLEHAHGRGLLHRDLKPSNILVTADGTPMILDFNLSADAELHAKSIDAKAKLGGTLPYMSPEHLDAFNPRGTTPASAVDERSDLYALGLILFELLTGHGPFSDPPTGLATVDMLRAMTEERRRGSPSVLAVNPQVPCGLDSIVRKCLEPDVDRRYRVAADLAEDLQLFLDDQPLRHAKDPSIRERLAKWSRRNPRATASSSIALLAMGLVIGLGLLLSQIGGNLRSAQARLERDRFAGDFARCQSLLSTTMGAHARLDEGLALAESIFARYGLLAGDDRWREGPLVSPLSQTELDKLSEELAELLLLDARARVNASRGSGEGERATAFVEAIGRLDLAERIDRHPPPTLYVDRALYRRLLGLADLAEADEQRARRTPARSARDHYLIGMSLLAGGRMDEAEERLSRAVAMEPERYWGWFALGICHADQDRLDAASADFSVCTVLHPEFTWAHFNRGIALERAGRLVEARLAFDRAVALEPTFLDARISRGLNSLQLGDARAAAADLRHAIEAGRLDPVVLAARGEALARLGRRDLAEREFADALERRPDDQAILVARGFSRLLTNADGARNDFTRVLSRNASNARALLGLAHLERADDPEAALRHLEAALRDDPSFFDALQLRALVRARLGRPSALEDIDAIKSVPTPHRLYNAACALSLLAEALGDPRQAHAAIGLLRRAFRSGFPTTRAEADPDLKAARALPEYRGMLEEITASRPIAQTR